MVLSNYNFNDDNCEMKSDRENNFSLGYLLQKISYEKLNTDTNHRYYNSLLIVSILFVCLLEHQRLI